MRVLWLLLLLLLPLEGLAAAPELRDLRIWAGPESTRVVFDLSESAAHRLFTLQGPDRIVIDLTDVTRAPSIGNTAEGKGLITRVRSAAQQNGALRVVLDVGESVTAKSFSLTPSGDYGYRVVVDLYGPQPAGDPLGDGTSAFASAGAPGGEGLPSGVPVPSWLTGASTQAPAASPSAAPSSPAPSTSTLPSAALPSAPPAAAIDRAATELAAVQPGAAPAAPASAPIIHGHGTPATLPASIPATAPAAPASAPAATAPAAPAPPAVATAQTVALVVPSASPASARPAAPASAPASSPPAAATGSALEERPIVIAIDAGHGGEDTGAKGPNGVREKDVALAMARRLARRVNAEPGFRAVLIRDGDYYVGLRERMRKARRAQADLFVSVHANAYHQRSVHGSAVYALSGRGATSEQARWLANKENASDLIGGVDLAEKDDTLAAVLFDISQTSAIEASLDVGARILSALGTVNTLQRDVVQQAGFAVLKAPDIPSVLVETAFITNPQEEKLLKSAEYQDKLMGQVFAGIRSYFDHYRPLRYVQAGTESARNHVVRPGDTLSQVAQLYRVSMNDLKHVNGLDNESLREGDVLQIPVVQSH